MLFRQIAYVLIKTGKNRELITYGELSGEINSHFGGCLVYPISISGYIKQVCYKFYENFSVFPGSVVVSKSARMPSKGYFSFIEKFGFKSSDRKTLWLELLNQFYEFCEVFDGNNSLLDNLSNSYSLCLSVDAKRKRKKKNKR